MQQAAAEGSRAAAGRGAQRASCSGRGLSWPLPTPRCGGRRFQTVWAMSGPSQPAPDARAWWDGLNKRAVKGPAPPAVDPPPTTHDARNELEMGVEGWRDFSKVKREERQRVWDAMRRIARQRYERGEMPAWFKPAWLDIEEAPTNTFWRAKGLKHWQQDEPWLGDDGSGSGGGSGGGSSGGSGGNRSGWWGWWREEDPYWPLRDWGDHPMRWWTLGFAALLVTGGVIAGSPEAAFIGLGSGAVLGLCGAAMSDMRHGVAGHLAVKAAFATCALLAAHEYWFGWRHKRRRRIRTPHLEGCGWTALVLCGLYAWTGMSGLSHYALPTNPGEAFKMASVAEKHKVWARWGYADIEMR